MNATTQEDIVLELEQRDLQQKAKRLRSKSRIPAVYYGQGQKNMHLTADYQTFRKLYEKAGSSTVIQLSVDGKKYPVLVHDVDYDAVTDQIAHIDFKHVDMNKEVTAEIKIEIIGVAPAVKNLGGTLEVNKHSLEIKCLPKDLIHSIQVDVSGLEELNSSIHVQDLKVPSTVEILAEPEETVVKVSVPRQEVEEEKPEEAAEVAEGEAAGEKKEGEGEGKKEEK
ncbi:50S ribosomal protein L25 [Candidatus Peregrinibacteria bacterium CG11_big_fil_rev_8_21_14_0_20_46_8]|nr:MAG: 50S ribosomal protein L25 [Candidatus Peregrinibacteria bacterium CG11_big_fil_rev_8_21_14_0_20_46_8]